MTPGAAPDLQTYVLFDRVKVRWGWPDGHVEIDFKAPFPIGTIHREIALADLEKVKALLDKVIAWGKTKIRPE